MSSRHRTSNASPTFFLIILLSALLQGCATPGVQLKPSPLEVPNLGELKQTLREYQKSGAYDADIANVDNLAVSYLVERAPQVARPAIVLDIDETSLSNWPQLAANDFAYFAEGKCDDLPKGPCGTLAWDASGQAKAIAPTLTLYRRARSLNVAVFFITGRYEAERAATESNLRKEGYSDWSGLTMRPDATKTPSAVDFKAPERVRIEAQGFTILANVGDQPSDLAGGHSEKKFLLPNPYYRIK